jgi:hypothetical protein
LLARPIDVGFFGKNNSNYTKTKAAKGANFFDSWNGGHCLFDREGHKALYVERARRRRASDHLNLVVGDVRNGVYWQF